MRRRLLAAAVIVLAVAACSGPESGQDVRRHYEAAYDYWQNICVGYSSSGSCTVWVPILNHMPEEWLPTLRNGTDEGDREVTKQAYDACRPGSFYPSCAGGALNGGDPA